MSWRCGSFEMDALRRSVQGGHVRGDRAQAHGSSQKNPPSGLTVVMKKPRKIRALYAEVRTWTQNVSEPALLHTALLDFLGPLLKNGSGKSIAHTASRT